MRNAKRNGHAGVRVKCIAVMAAIALLGLCCAGLIACGHAYSLAKVDGKAATCTAGGTKAYWQCDGCDELFADADGTKVTTLEEIKTAAKGHTPKKKNAVPATCTADGVAEHWECADCDSLFADAEGKTATTSDAIKTAKTGHDLAAVSGKDATCMSAGNREHWQCNDCGTLFSDAAGTTVTTVEDVTVAVTDHDYDLAVTVAPGTYIEGTVLSPDKLTFALKCGECNASVAITEGVKVDPSKELAVGENTFTATYKELEKRFTVNAAAKSLTDIAVTYTGKTVYKLNEEFDAASLAVTATYDNGKNADVTGECLVVGDTSVLGDCRIEVSYGGKTKYIDITVVEKVVAGLTTELASPDKIFHVGQTVAKSDLNVRALFDDETSAAVTNFTLANAAITAETTVVEVEFAGINAQVSVSAHAAAFVPEVESTLTTHGTVAHYNCETCGKLYGEDFAEIAADDIAMPLMNALAVTDSKVSITDSDGKTVGLKEEQGHKFLSGSPNNYYGRIFIKYDLSVEKDTEVKLYLNTSTRTGDNKMNDVYSVKVNGHELTIGDEVKLPHAAANNWFSQTYTCAGNAKLIAGQNNVVEVTRLNLINKDLGGDRTYNYFGIGITPYSETAINYTELCAHVCEHCGKCTDNASANEMCKDKCEGHENEHFCANVCNICGECKDSACEDPACAIKCGCAEFSVMNESVKAVKSDGSDVNKNANEGNISANDSNAKKGMIKIIYTINSDIDTTAKLYIKTCSQTIGNSLAESYGFKFGTENVTVDGGIKMPQNEANKWKDIRYTYVGEVDLTAGINTIEITRFDMTERELNDYTGYNFFGIALSGAANFTFA